MGDATQDGAKRKLPQESTDLPLDRSKMAKRENNAQSIQYPNGVIKKTWAFGHCRQNDVKIEEVLQKHTLTTAVISSYCWDFEWLVSKFTKDTKFILVLQADTEAQEQFSGLGRVRLCFPLMNGSRYASMHSKLLLLFHPTHLRVVVPSANFIGFDWGETGEMENTVFLIDLPRRPHDSNVVANSFQEELVKFATALGLQSEVIQGLGNFDFSGARNVRFIHTIAGNQRETLFSTGFPQLGTAIRSLGLQCKDSETMEIDLAASSIGALTDSQLDDIYRSLRGQVPPVPAQNAPRDPASLRANTKFRLVFPTRDTVQLSKAGTARASTIFLRPEYFIRNSFPRRAMRDYQSTRPGMISHNKLILARTKDHAIVYVGSHNLSQSAWGTLSFDRKAKAPKFSAPNWECGIVLAIKVDQADVSTASEDDEDGQASQAILPFGVFYKKIDVPFEWPAAEYRQDQKPWCAGT